MITTKQKLSDSELKAVKFLLESNINPEAGLEEELFYLVSSLSPIVNVDLLIINKYNELLLSWREDEFYGKGWHLPGGCLRFGESFENRIQQTALEEIGIEVSFENKPITIKNVIRGDKDNLINKNIRGHNVAILFKCNLPKNFLIENKNLNKDEDEKGYLKWFSKIPSDILDVHSVYEDIFIDIGLKQ